MLCQHSTLPLLQVHTFYEAVACMLSDRGTTVSIDRAALLQQLMAMPNAAWRDIFERAATNPDTILQPEVVKEVYYSAV
jgi:exportin-1